MQQQVPKMMIFLQTQHFHVMSNDLNTWMNDSRIGILWWEKRRITRGEENDKRIEKKRPKWDSSLVTHILLLLPLCPVSLSLCVYLVHGCQRCPSLLYYQFDALICCCWERNRSYKKERKNWVTGGLLFYTNRSFVFTTTFFTCILYPS